jgi:hypothetical protein
MKTKILILSMLLLTTVITAFAQANGRCGENLTWTLSCDLKTLTISGTGVMKNYSYANTSPWYPYRSSITTVAIGNEVASIGEVAFYGCSSLPSITIPASITSIGRYAFEDCSNLSSITITENVTSIGMSAFDGCEHLTAIYVESGNEYFSSEDGVLFNKDKTCLLRCPGGKTGDPYSIPNSVTIIEDLAFSGCGSLTSITIPASVTSIGDRTFLDCSGLTSVTIGNRVTNIEAFAFSSCSSLISITIPSSVTSIGERSFYGCSNLTSITIPNSVKNIGEEAFRRCSSLTSITIPGSVTSIRARSFSNCSSLTSITILNGVASIEYYAFSDCGSLSFVSIPESVTSIGMYAFDACEQLTSFINLNPTPPDTPMYSSIFAGVNLANATLYVPANSIETYKVNGPWKNFGTITAYDPTAIHAPVVESTIGIYPNPVKESFHIGGITAPAQVIVSDINGKTVLRQTVSSKENISVGHLPKGVYLVRINGKTVKTTKN